MALSKPELPSSSDEVDRLSELPEPLLLQILSFLSLKFAIRTSAVSRRFRHLWTASPSVNIDRLDFHSGVAFNDAINRFFRLRNPSAPLVRISLKSYLLPPNKSVINWLNSAHALGLRELSIHTSIFEAFFPHILSFHSLQSLELTSCASWDLSRRYFLPATFKQILPPTFLATNLRSLHFQAKLSSSDVRRFIMEQNQLEYLCLEAVPYHAVDIFSPTVKKAKLIFGRVEPKINLSFPVLQFLDLSILLHPRLTKFEVEMPLLKKANLKIPYVSEVSVPVLGEILRCFCNVSELSIHVGDAFPDDTEPSQRHKRLKQAKYQFHLIELRKGLPTFCHLQNLKLSMCFHKYGISDLICFLQNTPVLESLQLHHVEFSEGWESKLPQDLEGNDQHVHFSNLHLGDTKIELVRCLRGEGHHTKCKRRRMSHSVCITKAKVDAILAKHMEKVTAQLTSTMQTFLERLNLPPLLTDNPPRQSHLPTQRIGV
ncbi:F-box/FBD/LRR protein [Rhynchospora pubera]|uniref:F-box/FBD/LRR protein n=1 Tax=Rhynchospora pubera TaxID=906938 RepID=A0AAV8H9M1_9POAL|nr:F-box/FBD/LRR protein [Rhynchospora pubera]